MLRYLAVSAHSSFPEADIGRKKNMGHGARRTEGGPKGSTGVVLFAFAERRYFFPFPLAWGAARSGPLRADHPFVA